MSVFTKGVDRRQRLTVAHDDFMCVAEENSVPRIHPQNTDTTATGQGLKPAGGDFAMSAIPAAIGHNGGPADDWIKWYRDVRYHPIVGFLNEDGTPRKGVVINEHCAWEDLCMEAGWKARKFNNKGKIVTIERGQLVGARAWLAARWGWTSEAVRWFLKKLEREGMIEISTGNQIQSNSVNVQNHTQSSTQRRAHYSNIISICNYDVYQAAKELDILLNAAQQPIQHPINTQSTPNQHPESKKERIVRTEREREILLGAHPREQGSFLDSVEVNCVAINGPGFSLPFDALDLTSTVLDISPDKGRRVAEAQARAWFAQGLVPKNPIALATAAMRKFAEDERKAEAAAERLAKRQAKAEAAGAPPPKAEPQPLPGGEKWFLPQKWGAWAVQSRGLERTQVLFIADNFKRYYTSEDCKRPNWRDWEKVWQGWVDRAIARGDVLKLARKTAADLVRPDDMPEPIWQDELTRMVRAKEVLRQDAIAAGWMGA